MIIEGNAMERHAVQPGVLQNSPVSPILFVINTSGLIKSVQEYISAQGLCFVDHLSWVVTRWDVNQVVMVLD